MSFLFDFHHLDGLEAAAHVRSVLVAALPAQALVSERNVSLQNTSASSEDVADENITEDAGRHEDYEPLCMRLLDRKQGCRRRQQVQHAAKSARTVSKCTQKPHLAGRWSSFVVGLMRKERGCGASRGRIMLWRRHARQDRKHRLEQFGLEEPELMPKCERWLRSSFQEEHVDRKRRKVFKTRRVCIDHNEGYQNDLHTAKTHTSESPSRWALLMARMLQSHGAHLGAPYVSRKQLRAHVLQPSVAAINRWAHLHGANTIETVATRPCADFFYEALPHELTLRFQQRHAESLEQRRWRKQMRSRWSRMSLALRELQLRQRRRDALRELVVLRARRRDALRDLIALRTRGHDFPCSSISRECCRDEWIFQGWHCQTCGRGCSVLLDFDSWRSVPVSWELPASSEEVLAAQLGLDVATYRLLRQLEEREIQPEDYELLGRLDETVKPKTLTSEDLKGFATRVYAARTTSSSNSTVSDLPEFGAGYWRLPLEVLEDDSEETLPSIQCFGIDFWKVPMAKLEDGSIASRSCCDEEESPCNGSIDVCGVCLVDFEDGDKLRMLPCSHHFHRDCIDHWLLNSAAVCPVCKQDPLHAD